VKINDQKITKELCAGKILIFCPKTEDEAIFINRQMGELGLLKQTNPLKEPARCVTVGFVLKDSELHYFDAGLHHTGFVCTKDQFDKNYISPETAFIMEQFNKLSAKVDAIYEELKPAKLDKNNLKKPGQDA
jgi:hypothetical protein